MRRSPIALFALAPLLAAPAALAADCPVLDRDAAIAVAKRWHEDVINRRNPGALSEILGENLVHHAAGGYPETLDVAGVASMMDDFLGAFPDLSYSFDLMLADGDFVVERYTATGTQSGPLGSLAPTGRKATWTGVNIFRLDCGRIVEVWSEVDALSRNRQLGGG